MLKQGTLIIDATVIILGSAKSNSRILDKEITENFIFYYNSIVKYYL